MSGVNGHGSPQAGFGPAPLQAGTESDPSMEDILASIRRILSEDETLTEKPGSQPDEVLNLDESMLVTAPKHDGANRPAPPDSPLGINTPQPEPTPVQPATQPAAAHQSAPTAVIPPEAPMKSGNGDGRGVDHANGSAHPAGLPPVGPLVAQAATDAASASMGALMRTLAAERQVSLYRGGPTLEDMVRDEMRPILKEWLDSNLPALVERVVRAEIERVSQRAGG
jgi:cell pole-organizing protein PopZ